MELGDHRAQDAVHRAGVVAHPPVAQADDALGVDAPLLAQDLADGLVAAQRVDLAADDAPADVLVARRIAPLQVQRLQAVGERVVADIVEQPGGEHAQQVALGRRGGKLFVVQQRLDVHAHATVHAQAVLEAGVHRAGVDQMGRPQLAHAPQALERRVIDDGLDAPGHRDVSHLGHAHRAGAVEAAAKFGQRWDEVGHRLGVRA